MRVRLWLDEGSPGRTVFTGRQFASGATVWWTLLCQLRNHAAQDFLGPIGFVAANLAANWPQAALVKRDTNPAKTAL